MMYFSAEQIAESYHKMKWFDKYCLDSAWVDEMLPFPSKETIDSLIDNAIKVNKNDVVERAVTRLEFIKNVKECLELEIIAINEFLNNETQNVSIFEKMKIMSLVEMSVFFNSILSKDSLLDDMWCGSCHKSHGCCPVGDGECIHTDKDVIIWFLKQPYDFFAPLLAECSKYHQRRDSE